MPKWDFERTRDNLRIRGTYPVPGSPRGTLVVEGPSGAGLEAWFGPTPAFPDEWIEWRDPDTAECMRREDGNIGWIEFFRVPKHLRGRGVGAMILERALLELRALGVETVWLFAAPEAPQWKEFLTRFYKTHGFQVSPDCGENGNAMVLRFDRTNL